MGRRDFRYYGQRPARDDANLRKIDDLINMATGATDKNVIDFKMLQFILYLLAGHVNILEQLVELRLPRSGDLTLEEYVEDANRGESSKKPSMKEKGERAPGGKKGDDDLRTGQDDRIDRGRAKEGVGEVLYKGGKAIREREYDSDSKERDKGGKRGEKDYGDKIGGKGEKRKGKDKDKDDMDEIDRRGTEKRPGKVGESDSDIEYKERGEKRRERDDGDRRRGKGEIRKGKDRDDTDEIDRKGTKKRAGKAEGSDSDIQYRDRGAKRGERDDGDKRGDKDYRVKGKEDKLDTYSSKRGRRISDSESVDGVKVKRSRSFEIESSDRGKRQGRDESLEKYEKTRSRSLDRHRDKRDKQSQDSSDEYVMYDEDKGRHRKSCDTGVKRIQAKRVKDEDEKEGDDYVDVKYAGKLDSKGRDYDSGRRAGRPEDGRGGKDENISVRDKYRDGKEKDEDIEDVKIDGRRGGKGDQNVEDYTGGSVGKGRGRETKDKGKGLGRDSEDEYLDTGKGGRGKRKDEEMGGKSGRKVDKGFDEERRGKKDDSSGRDKANKRQDKNGRFETDDTRHDKKYSERDDVDDAMYLSGGSDESDYEKSGDRRHGGPTGIKYVDHDFPAQPRPRGKSEDVKSTGMSSDDGRGDSEYDEKVTDADEYGDTISRDGKVKVKGKVGDTDKDGTRSGKDGKGRGKRYLDESDEDDEMGGKDRKGRGKGKVGDTDKHGATGGKDRKGRGKRYLDESDEDSTGGSVVKGRGRHIKEKGKGLGRDSEDEYLDRGKNGRGKRKGEDIEDVEREGTRGGKAGRKGDRDYEGERRARGDKDVGGRGKGKGGEGYDDEDEDDTKGRGGAGARAGKSGASQGAADKDAAGRKKGGAREATLTSAATGASVGGRGREGAPRVGSIDLVTQDQFKQLERAVKELQKKAGHMAGNVMPNEKLMKDILKGGVSLTDVIATLEIQARLQAAERAIDRLADLIAQLAAAGALTPEALARIADIRSELGGDIKLPPILESQLPSAVVSKGGTSLKGRSLKESSAEGGLSIGTTLRWKVSTEEGMSMGLRDLSAEGGMSMATSKGSSLAPSFGRSLRSTRSGCVSPDEMRDALQALREEFMNKANKLGGHAIIKANAAEAATKALAEKVAGVEELSDAVTESYNTVNDYTTVLHGFDSGIEMQMAGYYQQLDHLKAELLQGLVHQEQSCNNAETRPILDLGEDMDILVNQRDSTHDTHQALTTMQKNLDGNVQDLKEFVELLSEVKVDIDEVEDALKDKADLNRINGIVTKEDFNNVYSAMMLRLDMCFDKFRAQDKVWTKAAEEINGVIMGKCDARHMDAMQEQLLQEMRLLEDKAKRAAELLEYPKVAVLARRLYKESKAAVKATMDVTFAPELTEPPRQAPRPRPTGDGAEDVCGRTYTEEVSGMPVFTSAPCEEDRRSHICNRWCGGSHTLVNETVTREFARPFPTGDTGAVRRRMGQGTDNKLYMMAYHPCECSVESIPGEAEDLCPHYGAGDQGGSPTIVTGNEARRVTIVHDTDLRLMRVETAGRTRGSDQRGPVDYGPSATGSPPAIDSQGFVNKVKVGVVVQGRFTVVDEKTATREAPRRSSLAEERIREQFATVASDARDSM